MDGWMVQVPGWMLSIRGWHPELYETRDHVSATLDALSCSVIDFIIMEEMKKDDSIPCQTRRG